MNNNEIICPSLTDSKIFEHELKKYNHLKFIIFYEDDSYEIDKIVIKEQKMKGFYLNITEIYNETKLKSNISPGNECFEFDFKVTSFEDQERMLNELKYIQIPYIDQYVERSFMISVVYVSSNSRLGIGKNCVFNIPIKIVNHYYTCIRADQQKYLKTSDMLYSPVFDFNKCQFLKSLIVDEDIQPYEQTYSVKTYNKFNNNPNLEYIYFKCLELYDFYGCFNNNPKLIYVDFGFNGILRQSCFNKCNKNLTIKLSNSVIYAYIKNYINYDFGNSINYEKIGEHDNKYYYCNVSCHYDISMMILENTDILNKQLFFKDTIQFDGILTSMYRFEFKHSTDLTTIHIPNTIIIIDNPNMFKDCHKLKRVIIGGGNNKLVLGGPYRYDGETERYIETIFDLTGCYELEEFPFKYCNGQDTKLNMNVNN